MSKNDADVQPNVSQGFIQQLEQSGFFRQIQELEGTLRRVAGDLKVLGESTVGNLEDTESLVAHVIALESAVTVLLKEPQQDAEVMKVGIRSYTGVANGSKSKIPQVLATYDA
ncbi:MAG: hypothetical protein ACKVK8_06135 [Rhodospirillales bacterium]|jgi:hypothetical protein